jgi:hypothetical protein
MILCMGCPRRTPWTMLSTPVCFLSYRHLSPQFQFSLSAATLVYLSQWFHQISSVLLFICPSVCSLLCSALPVVWSSCKRPSNELSQEWLYYSENLCTLCCMTLMQRCKAPSQNRLLFSIISCAAWVRSSCLCWTVLLQRYKFSQLSLIVRALPYAA